MQQANQAYRILSVWQGLLGYDDEGRHTSAATPSPSSSDDDDSRHSLSHHSALQLVSDPCSLLLGVMIYPSICA